MIAVSLPPLPLLRGWLIPAVTAAGAVALVVALGWRDRRWRLAVAVVAAASVALVWLVNLAVGGSWIFQPAPPPRVWMLAAIPVFIAAAAVLGWGSASTRQRLLVVPAFLLCTIAAAGFADRYYGYYPTLGSMFGARPAQEVSVEQLRARGLLGSRRDTIADATVQPMAPAAAALPAARDQTTSGRSKLQTTSGRSELGRVVEMTIPGTVSGFHARPAWVYLPPAYFGPSRPQLSAVILLEGTPGSPQDWIRAIRIEEVANAYAAAHLGVAPILVAVDQNGSYAGDTECVDRPGARADTYISVDVRNFVARTFDVPLRADRWALEGYSEGGTCALTLALRHPDLFHTFVDTGGDAIPSIGSPATTLRVLYRGSTTTRDSYEPTRLLRRGAGRAICAWFEIGTADHHSKAATGAIADLARQEGVIVNYRTVRGPHTFHLFRAGFADSFTWLSERLGAG